MLSPLAWHCTQNNPVIDLGENPEISNLIAPSVVYTASFKKHVISVLASDPQGIGDLDKIRYEIVKTVSNPPVSQGELTDSGSHGDIIANDGVFVAQIDSRFALNDVGEFELRVFAVDKSGNTSNTLAAKIFVQAGVENEPPEIVTVQAPTTVAVDSSFTFILTAEVHDPEGLSDIQDVIYAFFPPSFPTPTITSRLLDSGQFGDVTAGDGIYSAELSSGLFGQAADYFIRLHAEDKSGNVSGAKVISIRGFFQKGNKPPVLANLVAPDTVKIDPNQDTRVLITIDVSDPQGLGDLDYVRFRSFLPNGNEAQQSPFDLSDDGDQDTSGDETAGDGTYSILIILPSSGVPTGDFRFVFQAKDRSGAFSNEIEHIMTVTN